MTNLAITGEIKSGKSLFAKLLAKKLNCQCISLDSIVNDIIRDEDFENVFSFKINSSDLRAKKTLISGIIFEDERKRKAYEDYIWKKARAILEEKLSNISSKYVVIEIPLLFQSSFENLADIIIYLKTEENVRRERYLKSKKIADNSLESFNKRNELLKDYYNKNKTYIDSKVNYFVDNSADIEKLKNEIDIIYKKINIT